MEYRLISVIALKGGTGFRERPSIALIAWRSERVRWIAATSDPRLVYTVEKVLNPLTVNNYARDKRSTIRWDFSVAKHHSSNILRSPSCELICIERERERERERGRVTWCICMYCDSPVRDLHSWFIREFLSGNIINSFRSLLLFIHRWDHST